MRPIVSLVVVIGLLSGCEEPTPTSGTNTPIVRPIARPLDLNTATEKQLEALPAIGRAHARSIIASRNARGGRFTSLDNLLQIDGIGPKTIEAIRPYVVVP